MFSDFLKKDGGRERVGDCDRLKNFGPYAFSTWNQSKGRYGGWFRQVSEYFRINVFVNSGTCTEKGVN